MVHFFVGGAIGFCWLVEVYGPIKLIISLVDGIIKLEGFSLRTEFGKWEIAAPDSFDSLAAAIRQVYTESGKCNDRRMAKRERYVRHAVTTTKILETPMG